MDKPVDKSKAAPKDDDLDDYLNNAPPQDYELSTIEMLRNELSSLVDTMMIPDAKVKSIINIYAPGKNSKQLSERELDQVIQHIKLS